MTEDAGKGLRRAKSMLAIGFVFAAAVFGCEVPENDGRGAAADSGSATDRSLLAGAPPSQIRSALESFLSGWLPPGARFTVPPIEFRSRMDPEAISLEQRGIAGYTEIGHRIVLGAPAAAGMLGYWERRQGAFVLTEDMLAGVVVSLHEAIHNITATTCGSHGSLEEGLTHDIATVLVPRFVGEYSPRASLPENWRGSVGMVALSFSENLRSYEVSAYGGGLGDSEGVELWTVAAILAGYTAGDSEGDYENYIKTCLRLKSASAACKWPGILSQQIAERHGCPGVQAGLRAGIASNDTRKIMSRFRVCLSGKPSGKASRQRARVVVYGAQGCPPCQRLKSWLKERGIRFRYHDVENRRPEDDGWTNEDGTIIESVPMWVVGNVGGVGFDPARLEELLGDDIGGR